MFLEGVGRIGRQGRQRVPQSSASQTGKISLPMAAETLRTFSHSIQLSHLIWIQLLKQCKINVRSDWKQPTIGNFYVTNYTY